MDRGSPTARPSVQSKPPGHVGSASKRKNRTEKKLTLEIESLAVCNQYQYRGVLLRGANAAHKNSFQTPSPVENAKSGGGGGGSQS